MANSRDADFQKVKYTTKKKLSDIDADNNCFLVMNVFIVNAFLTIITLTTFTLPSNYHDHYHYPLLL